MSLPQASAELTLPTLHADQVRLLRHRVDPRAQGDRPSLEWAANGGGRFRAVRCGRRWGKSAWLEVWLADGALKGNPVGYFAPGYKLMSETYYEMVQMLDPVIPRVGGANKTDGVIRLVTGGRIDFWTLEDERAGRSRMYRRVGLDEAAFAKEASGLKIWEESIKPTLLDLGGAAVVASNTNGVDPENLLYALCNDPRHGFVEFHAPSWNNPHVPRRLAGETSEAWRTRHAQVYATLREREPPLVFAQEYAAEFVDWSGVAFFSIEKLMVSPVKEGMRWVETAPLEHPKRCDAVFATVDCAVKTGSGNDGTAVIYWAQTLAGYHPLVILDWDYVQIEGALLETWLPNVLAQLETYARDCKARSGSLGAFIEDKSAGEVLLQQAARRRLPARAIESRLTALGKDERALSVSGYVHRGDVKITKPAYDRVVTFKGVSRNHLVSQVTGFRIGDKDAGRRADDLLDTFCYGPIIALGDAGGF